MRRAALRPGAPMMPPPGCVADPPIHNWRIGVAYCAHPGDGRRKNNCSSDSSPWKMLPSLRPNSRFEIQRRHHLTVQDDVADVRGVLRNRVDHRVAQALCAARPQVPRARARARVHEAGQDVFPGGAIAGSVKRRDHHVEERPPRELPVLRPRRARAPGSPRPARSRSRRRDARPGRAGT